MGQNRAAAALMQQVNRFLDREEPLGDIARHKVIHKSLLHVTDKTGPKQGLGDMRT